MTRTALLALLASFPVVAGKDAITPTSKVMLFNGSTFDGLVRFLPPGRGDVNKTWTIKPDGVIACTGRPTGYLRTEKSYRDYKIHVEYRWTDRPGNNGILVHLEGEDRIWPNSLERQAAYRNNGDFFEIGGFEFNEHRIKGDRVRGRRVLKYGEHNEREPGQWNVNEVWYVGGTVRIYVNGKLMNEATDCSRTEGSPIEFRNVSLEPLERK